MRKSERKQSILVGVLLLLLGCLTFFYWAEKKEVWFCDEIYTYESANGFEQSWPATNLAQWMSGDDVEGFFSADADRLLLYEISDRLYSDHVPLYFWIFRIVSFIFFHGSGTIWIGLSMNLVMYVFLLLTVYGIFLYLLKNPAASGISVIASCVVNRLMIEQATTLRMYLMLVLLEIALLLCGYAVVRNAVDKGKLSWKTFVLLFAASLAGLLTHYDFWIFYAATAGCCCLYLLFVAIREKKKRFIKSVAFRAVLAWIGNFVAALGSTIAIFPYCRWNLNRGKGEIALHSMFDFSPEKLRRIAWGYKRFSISVLGEKVPVLLGLVLLFGCILAAGILLWKKKEYLKFTCLVLTVAITQLYQFVVCFTMPALEEERYLWGSFSILSMCAVLGSILLLQWAVSFLQKKERRKLVFDVAAAVLAAGFLILQWNVMDGGNGVAYLFYPGKDVKQLEAHREDPWLVYGPIGGVYSYYDWLIPEKICFLSSDNTEEEAAALQQISQEERIVLYTMKEYYPQALKFLEKELGRTFTGEYLFDSTSLSVYVLQ